MEFAGGLHLDGAIEGNLRADPSQDRAYPSARRLD